MFRQYLADPTKNDFSFAQEDEFILDDTCVSQGLKCLTGSNNFFEPAVKNTLSETLEKTYFASPHISTGTNYKVLGSHRIMTGSDSNRFFLVNFMVFVSDEFDENTFKLGQFSNLLHSGVTHHFKVKMILDQNIRLT